MTWKVTNSQDYAPKYVRYLINTEAVTPGTVNYNFGILAGTVDINWGDGTSNTGVSANTTHTYSSPGYYVVTISQNGTSNFRPDIGLQDISVEHESVEGGGFWNNSMYQAAYSASNLKRWGAVDLGNVTNLRDTWRGCSSMTTFSPTDMSSCTLFGTNTLNGNFAQGAWMSCSSLASFPAADMSSATDIGWAWHGCNSMTSFGSITLPAGSPTYAAPSAWRNCSNLTLFPAIDLSGATDLRWAWNNCSSMTTFSPTDMSNCTLFGANTADGNYAYGAWRSCSSLTSFPAADMSSATNIGWAWQGCSSMTSFGSITLPTGSPAYGAIAAWRNCGSLTSFPAIDLSGATDLRWAWNGCSSMTTFSPTDMSNCTLFGTNTDNGNFAYGAWRSCSSLTSFPAADMSSGIDYSWAWYGCSSMTSFGSCTFNTTSTSTFRHAWSGCSSLTTFPANMFDNVIATVFHSAFTGCALTVQSVENILVSIDTSGVSNGTLGINGGTTAGQASWTTAATTAYNNLISKGWTITANA